MDFMSPSQLRSYESIIEKIQSEHEKSAKLKQEIEKENNKIIISHLSKSKPSQKIAHVNIKIFSDILELFHLYRDELNCDISSFFKNENCKYYLVEVFITNALYKKLKDISVSLIISVKYDNVCLNKALQVKTSVMPILEVIPVDENVIDSKVTVTLILPTDDNHCFNISLATVLTDISYHFENNKTTKFISAPKKIFQLSKLYNPNFNFLDIHKPLWIEYQFLTNINSKEFVKMFIQNCYHKIDLEYFSELGNESQNLFVLKFSTGFDKHTITFDRSSRVITIKSNLENLVHLKNYFCKEELMELKDSDFLKKDVKQLLLNASTSEEKEELRSFYIELRRFWTKSHA